MVVFGGSDGEGTRDVATDLSGGSVVGVGAECRFCAADSGAGRVFIAKKDRMVRPERFELPAY